MGVNVYAVADGYVTLGPYRMDSHAAVFALEVHHGLFKPEVIARVLKQPSAEKRGENSILTERELEVLRAASRGERSKEIALHLGIAERTVKAHLDSVYNKLGVYSRAAAVTTEIERGLLSKKS